MPRFNSPVCITFHSIRRRLTDPDGASIKAACDGLVKAGILADDTAQQIKEIRQTQELCKVSEDEKTIITISDEEP